MSAKIEQRISSQICRTTRDGEVVYKKQYVTNEWDNDADLIQQRARREIELLQQIMDSNSFRGRLGVVRVAEADPEVATIATHEVAGKSLEQFVRQNREAETHLAPWLLAGRWLKQFQELPLNGTTNLESQRDPQDIVEYCDLRLHSLSDYSYPWPDESTHSQLLEKISELRELCKPSELKPVWAHADYSPGNLMWDGRVLTPIDFAMVRSGKPLDDATYLIHRIEMHRVYRPWLRLPVQAIRRAVLRGLGMPEAEQSPAYKMLMIKHQICRLHTYARRSAKNLKQSLHDRWVRAAIKKRLVQSLSQSTSRSVSTTGSES